MMRADAGKPNHIDAASRTSEDAHDYTFSGEQTQISQQVLASIGEGWYKNRTSKA